MISARAKGKVLRYHEEFAQAFPFPHVVIDDFFETESAERLLTEFPPFSPANARNEFGIVGGKAVVTQIADISPFYAEVYRYLGSADFLGTISQITGIPDLLHDELMYGGGTHENLEGQELDPHVDFNYHEKGQMHRRLNLLLYLNKTWDGNWGGSLELHSNPRRPKENRIRYVDPLFNRCVIFETSERSWHGFRRIHFPAGQSGQSRKLLSVYLYTRERPAEQTVPPHGTFYVQRPIPAHLLPGHALKDEDVRELNQLIAKRDAWIEYYQNKELSDAGRIQDLGTYARALEAEVRDLRWLRSLLPEGRIRRWCDKVLRALKVLPPRGAPPDDRSPDVPAVSLRGGAVQVGRASGFWADGWFGTPFEVTLRFLAPADSISVVGYLPEQCKHELNLRLQVNGRAESRWRVVPGHFTLRIDQHHEAEELLRLRIESDSYYCPARAGTSADLRNLVAVLQEIRISAEAAALP